MESNRQRHRYTNGAKAMNTAFLALALMACFSGSSLATFDTGFGIAVLDITRTNLNPPLNTEWRLSVGLTNFLGIVGFDIWVYLEEFGTGGIIINDVVDKIGSIIIFPGVSVAFQDNIVQGGTLNQLGGALGPIFIDPNCIVPLSFDPFSDPEPDCSGFPPRVVLDIFITVPKSVGNSDILVGGPSPAPNKPLFAVSTIINPNATDDTPGSPPSPPGATVKSDPHLKGLRGQEFDVTGEEGKTYNLISEYYGSEKAGALSLVVNAVFAEAYTTGLQLTPDNGANSFYKSGTWISTTGILAAGVPIIISVDPLSDLARRGCTNPKNCLNFGSATVMGFDHALVGTFRLSDRVGFTVKNSKSYTRFLVESPQIHLQVDIVSPPKSWNVAKEDEARFSHINIQVLSASLSSGIGLIGETIVLKYDEQGKPIVKGMGKDGEGLLNFPISSYEVPSLTAPFAN